MSFRQQLPKEFRGIYSRFMVVQGTVILLLLMFTIGVTRGWFRISAELMGWFAILGVLVIGGVTMQLFSLVRIGRKQDDMEDKNP